MKQSRLTNNNTEGGSPHFLSTLSKCCSGLLLLLLMMSFQLGAIEVDKSDASTFCSADLEQMMSDEDAMFPSEDETDSDFNLFVSSSARTAQSELSQVTAGTLFSIDMNELAAIRAAAPMQLTISIPGHHDTGLELNLQQIDIFADGFAVETSGNEDLSNIDLGVHYKGYVEGASSSLVAFSVYENHIASVISTDGIDYNLGKLKNSTTEYILYNPLDLTTEVKQALGNTSCIASGVFPDDIEISDEDLNYSNRNVGDAVTVYLVGTSALYADNGSSMTATLDRMTSAFAQTSVAYSNESILVQASGVFVWTVAEPFVAGLSTFRDYYNGAGAGWPGAIAHLIDGPGDGTGSSAGGVAYLDVLCGSSNNYGYTSVGANAPVANVPLYSRYVKVLTHEIGHNIGAPHTQACEWNGDNTQIDDYGNTDPGDAGAGATHAGNDGVGDCYTVQPPATNPLLTVTPTIMSYYDSRGYGDFPLGNGFGFQPGNLIRAKVAASTCLSPPTCSVECPDEDQVVEVGSDCIGTMPCFASRLISNDCLTPTVTQSPDCGATGYATGDVVPVTLTVTHAGGVSTCQFNALFQDNTPPVALCNNLGTGVGAIEFIDDFSDNSAGWSFGPEWGIGATSATTCGNGTTGQGPALDNTPSGDNSIAGINVGGCASTILHGYYYLTSPVVDASNAGSDLLLEYYRWLNSDYTPFMQNIVEVYDGTTWVTLYITGPSPGVNDASWAYQAFNISAYANANLQVRFGMRIGSAGVYNAPSWSIDDFSITGNASLPALSLDENGEATITVADIDGGSFDNCGIDDIELNITDFNCTHIGANTVTMTVTDVNGNTSTCLSEVVVIDDLPPVAVCADLDLDLNESGHVTISTGDVSTSTDNCAIAGEFLSQTFFDCSNVGDNTVTLTVIDVSGNSSTCSFTVTITDVEDPVALTCPTEVELAFNLDCPSPVALPDYSSLASFQDNCPLVTITQDPAPGTDLDALVTGANPPFAPGSIIPITLTATDASGNTAVCEFDVVLTDDAGPHIACPGDQLVYTGEDDTDCMMDMPDYTGLASAGVLCGNELATITQVPAADAIGTGTYTNGDVITVTLTAEDASGLTESCSFDVAFCDNTAPVLLGATATTTYGPGSLGPVPPTGTNGTSTFVLDITDDVDIADLNVVLLDIEHTFSGDLDIILTSPSGTDVQLFDQSCGADNNIQLNFDDAAAPGPPTCPSVGFQTIQPQNGLGQVLADYNGESTLGLWTLTVIDYLGGDLGAILNWNLEISSFGGVCDDPAPITLAPGECSASITLTPPSASDNCDPDPLEFGIISGSGDSLNVANGYTGDFAPCETEVTWYAEDAKGNVSEALCIVTVTVTEPIHPLNQPEAQCIGSVLLGINDTGMVELCAEDIDNGSSDNCVDGALTYQIHKSDAGGNTLPDETIQDCVTYDCSDLETGPHYVCLIVTDCSGNSSSCITEVDLEEKHDPYIACPADIVIECDVDNDGIPVTHLGVQSHLPDYPRANTAASSAATPDPADDFDAYLAWVAAGYGIGNPSPGQDVAAGITGLPIVYDNCGADITFTDEYFYYDGLVRVGPVSYISDLPINDPHECEHHNYEIERTWLVTDDYGRTASCMQLIIVQDTTDPEIAANGIMDGTVACDDAPGLAALLAPVPTATDNCYLSTFELIQDNSGAPEFLAQFIAGDCVRERITREWLATDACGNTSNLIQIINLIDTVAPELSVSIAGMTFTGPGPHAVELTTDLDLCNRSTDFTTISSDNCADVTLDAYTFLLNGQQVFPDAFLNFNFLNGTTSFSQVLDKGDNTFYVGVIDECLNLSYVEIVVTIVDEQLPAFEDCTEGTFTWFTSSDDVPVDEPDNYNCRGAVEIIIPPFQDNCPLTMDGMSGSIELMITLETGSAAAGNALVPYTLGWVDVTNDPDGVIRGGLPIGTHIISFMMTDASGNVAADLCEYTFVVVDDETPMLECPSNRIVTVSGDGSVDCAASYVDGHYGGIFGFGTHIVPEVADNCDYTATYTLSGATTGTGSFTYVPATFGPFVPASAPGMTFDLEVGNTSILIEVIDDAGNPAQCSFSVTVFDDIDPTIACPASIVASADAGVCTYTADVSPVVDDNCVLDRLEYVMSGATAASGTILAADLPAELAAYDFAVGSTDVTYTIFDVQGNSATCSYTVDISDDELPVIGCPEFTYVLGTSGTIYTNGFTGESIAIESLTHSGGDCETTVDGLEILTTDNCCVSSVQYQILDADGNVVQAWIAEANEPLPADADQLLDLSGHVFDKGTWTVELRAWDCHMNEGTCSFTVEVFDDEKPAFGSCPGDRSAVTVATSCFQTVTWTRPLDSEVLDNCLLECGVGLIQGPYFSYDADEDTADIDAGIVAEPISGGTESAEFPVGIRYVKYSVTDLHGNTEWCIFEVEVIDNINPTVASCSAGEELNFNLDCNDENTPAFPDYTGAANFDDNCQIASITQSIAAGTSLSAVFPTPFVDGAQVSVTLTATDLGGNTATCTFNVTLNDNIGPSIACPAEQTLGSTLYGNGDCTYTLPDFRDMATAQVLCGNEEATVVQTPGAGSIVVGPSVVVTLIATDGSGNSVACGFTVNLIDDSAPYLLGGSVCLDPAPVETAPGECEALIALTPPSDLMLVDNCSAYANLTIIGIRDDSPEPLTMENLFSGIFTPCETEVTWYAIDEAGNESEALCTVTVLVTEPDNQLNQPNPICLNIATLGLNDNGEAFICADDLDGGSSDCGDITILIARADENGPILGNPEVECLTYTCDDIGLQYVCLKVTDCSGNENFCTASFIVEDKKAPRIVCPADITIECDVDNNGDPLTYEGSLPPHALYYPAANTPVNIPTYNAWLITPILTTQGQNATNGITGLPLAYDNCSAEVTYVNNYFYWNADGDRVEGEYDQLPMNDPHECARHHYDIERVWTVTDAEGYTAECTQLIQVRDTESPVIDPNGIADALLECSDAPGIAAALAPVPTATDNCYLASMDLTFDNSGSPEDFGCIELITRVWTATDACGNTSTLTQSIYLNDTTDPTLSVSAEGNTYMGDANQLTVNTDPGLCSALVAFTMTADDNCDEDLYNDFGVAVNGVYTEITFLNGTTTFELVLDKGDNLVDVLVLDDCGNSDYVAILVTVHDNEDPAFADCTEDTYTWFTSDADAPVGEGNTEDCAARVRVEIPPFQDNCPLGSGSVQMYLTVDPSSTSSAGNAFNDYNGQWGDVTNDANNYIAGKLPVGTHTIEFIMTDDAGNTSEICSYTYDVVDDQDPILDCPSSMVVFLSGDGDADVDCDFDFVDGTGGLNSIIPLVSDNCGYTFDAVLSGATTGSYTDLAVPADLDFSLNVGATSFVYTATDAEGNQSQCSFVVTVIDDITPMITCPSFPDALIADAGVCYTTQDLAPELSDNCDGGYLSYILSGATALSGEINVEDLPGALAAVNVNVGITYGNYTYYDEEGNSISCSFSIEVLDEELPVVACPASAIVGTSGTVYATADDISSFPNVNGDCESTIDGLTFDATDNCCISSVQYRIQDNESGEYLTGWIVEANMPLPADGDMTLDLSDISFEKGEYTIYFRAWDCSMNEGLCQTAISVVDDEQPEFTDCPADQTVNQSPAACGQNVSWTKPSEANVLDNCLVDCGINDIQGPFVSFDADMDTEDLDAETPVIGNTTQFALFPVGTRYVKYYVTDAAGNITWCVFSVTVNDNIPPVNTSCDSDNYVINMDLNCDNTLELGDYTDEPDFTDICGFTLTQEVDGTFQSGDVVVDGQLIVINIIATDPGGNTAMCQLTLEVNDSAIPNIDGPSDQILTTSTEGVIDENCMFVLPDYTVAPWTLASPSCPSGSVTVTQSPAAGPMPIPTGPFFVTLTVTDDSSGNTNTSIFIVQVIDDAAPVLDVCAQTTASGMTAIGGCTASVTIAPPSAFDCAGVMSIWGQTEDGLTLTAGNGYTADFPACYSTVTWYAMDTNGNSSALEGCETEVTVTEPANEANNPTAACRTDLVLELGQDGVVSLYAETYGANSFDNCPGAELEYAIHIWENGAPVDPSSSEIEFGCDRVGVQTICLIVTDCSGNSATCFGTIIIQDRTDPELVCPAEITIDCHNDNGGDPATGPMSAVITPINVIDIANYDNTTGQDAASGITGWAQGWDNCDATVTYSDDSSQGDDPTACDYYTYTVERTWTITDLYGNDNDLDGNDCLQIINVQDVTDPYFLEAATDLDRAINCEDPNYDARMSMALALEPTPLDLCYVTMELVSEVTVEHDGCIVDRTGNADVFEQLVRTWIASDACGNTAIYVQYISIQDTTAPAIACPLDGVSATFYTSNGTGPDDCTADVNLIAFVVDCQDVDVTYTVNDITNSFIVVYSGGGREFIATDVPPGEYCIHFYATDPCGNTSDCLYFFDVEDNTDPVLDCSAVADIATDNDAGLCAAFVTFDHPILSDNCSGAELYADYGLGAGAQLITDASATVLFPVGTTTVTYTATDAEGLLALGCSFDVTVTDAEAPSFDNCPTEDVNLATSEDGFVFYECGMTDSWKSPFVGDNCGVVTYTIQIGDADAEATFGDESHQMMFPVGTTVIEYVATDAAGNTAICSVNVNVVDDEEPVTLCNDATIELDENGIAILDPALVGGGSYDNCEVFLAVSQGSFDCTELGEHTITMTASDAAGNSFWCTSTVTVEDNLAPELSGCDDQSADAADGTCEYLVSGTDWDATATDNCSATLTNDFTGTASLHGAAFPTGETTVTWTASDAAGNTATCSITVTIANPDLEAVCQSYINTNTLSLGDDGTLTLTAADFDGGSGSACDDLSFLISEDNGQTFASELTFDCSDITLGTPLNIVLEATDNATGDADQCIAQLSITDGPVLVEDCPTDVTVDANVDDCGALVTLTLPVTEGSCPVFAYSINGGGFIATDSDLEAFFEIGTYEVQWAITNASGADAVVSGTADNICSLTLTVNANGAILGCTDSGALNYNPSATCDDGSCLQPVACLTADELPYAEDFEEGLGLWYQEVIEDDFDWNVNSGPTESELTGPEGASSGDMYLYIESSYPNFPAKKATINSACLDLLEVEESSAQFAYNMNGEDVGTLELKVTVDGTEWETVWSQQGDQGTEWHEVEVDLSAYGDEMITLRFEGETSDNYYGDMAIDQFGLSVVPDPDPTCAGDITGDAIVDINDFLAFNSLFGTECTDCAEDLNNDGFVDIQDFLILNTNYGNDCNDVVVGALTSSVSLVEAIKGHDDIVIEEQLLKIINDMSALNFTIYPNPNEGTGINLFIDDAAIMVTVSVKDVAGRTLSTEAFAGSAKGLTHYVDFTEKLSAGVYTVVVDTDGKIAAKRFVVE